MSAAKIRAFIYHIDIISDHQINKQIINDYPIPEFVPRSDVKIATTENEANKMTDSTSDPRKVESFIKKLETFGNGKEISGIMVFNNDSRFP